MVIVDDPDNYWVWVRPSDWQHFGKWLVFSRDEAYLDELARKLDPYVEKGKIDSVKYNREPAPFTGFFAMCIYCDDRKREYVCKILHSLGVTERIWKYDHHTIEDRRPDGRLYRNAGMVDNFFDKLVRKVKSLLVYSHTTQCSKS